MSKVSSLTTSLIEQRPETAVKVVNAMGPDDAAAFLEDLPTRHAVAILSKSSAWSASTLVSRMTPVNGAAVLAELDYQTAASIMRISDDADRQKLYAALPKRLREDLRSTLTYPDDTVGAKMSATIVVMMANQTVADAVAELRQIKRAKTGVAFVVDETRKLLGVANAGELLQHSNDSLLSDVIDRSVAPISARARLDTIKSLPAWDDYAHMPVVNRKKFLIGALARKTFRQPAVQAHPDEVPAQTPSILASLASSFVASAIGLIQVLTDVKIKAEEPTERQPNRSAGEPS